jgi:hypothetical protein
MIGIPKRVSSRTPSGVRIAFAFTKGHEAGFNRFELAIGVDSYPNQNLKSAVILCSITTRRIILLYDTMFFDLHVSIFSALPMVTQRSDEAVSNERSNQSIGIWPIGQGIVQAPAFIYLTE